jgi:hypothetical protein
LGKRAQAELRVPGEVVLQPAEVSGLLIPDASVLAWCPVEVARKRSFGMDQVIIQSILKKRRLRFTYNGKTRLVEPQCYGIGAKGTELLRVYQIQGGSQREPLFDLSKMTNVVLLDDVFTKPGPNYKRNDSAMKTIFCQL